MATTVYRPSVSSTGDVAITGDIVASGTINTVGISSSANATAITIDVNENVGIGVSPAAWSSSWDVLQVGGSGSFSAALPGTGITRTFLTDNAYNDGTSQAGSWAYHTTDPASQLAQLDGKIEFRVAPSGTIDTTISWTIAMTVDNNGNLAIGSAAASGKLDIDQSSTTGAIPVLYLDQADISEEFVRFDAVEATGNPVEDVGAKTLTTTKFVRININGADLYLQAGTIA